MSRRAAALSVDAAVDAVAAPQRTLGRGLPLRLVTGRGHLAKARVYPCKPGSRTSRLVDQRRDPDW